MSFLFLLLGLSVAGFALSEFLWIRESRDFGTGCPALERLCSSCLLTLALWISLNWILSAFGALTPVPLLTCAAALGVGGYALACRLRPETSLAWSVRGIRKPALACLIACLPMLLWLAYSLYRGQLIPVGNHDANAYHMTKAAMFMKEGGYHYIDVADPRLAGFPCNYELLVADCLILERSDRWTASLTTMAWLLCALATAALIQRWWGEGPQTLACALFFAGMPVCLLGASQHKNDFLMTAFDLMAFLWTARWCAERGRAPFLLAAISVGCAVGTKSSAAFLLAGLAPFLIRAAYQRRSVWGWARGMRVALFIVATAFLLGAWVYVSNFAHSGNLVGAARISLTGTANTLADYGYGDFINYLMYPLELLTAPFELSNNSMVYNPIAREWWYWPHWEFFFSDYGGLFTFLVVSLPFGIRAGRKLDRNQQRSRERGLASAMILLTYLIALPMKSRPLGFFAFYPRYTMWVVPLVLAWTLAPLMVWLTLKQWRVGVGLVLAVLALVTAGQAIYAAEHDTFGDLQYVRSVAQHPDQRTGPFAPRACNLLDALAGPDDVVAVDIGPFDTWSYPLYGRDLRRQVLVLPYNGPLTIPTAAQWVVIDRSFSVIWGSPGLTVTDNPHMEKYLFHGQPSPADLRVFRALVNDPNWELVEGPALAPLNWVFHRKALQLPL